MRLAAWTLVCLLASGFAAARAGTDEAQPEIAGSRFQFVPPPLAFSLHYDDPRSTVGWGSFDLRASPTEHEFRVDMMLGTASDAPRWSRCDVAGIDVDGAHSQLPVRYSGVPLSSGVWDAVQVELTIDHVRSMAVARNVAVDLCGDVVAVRDEKLGELDEFIRRFEEMATYEGPPAPEPPPPLDWEPEMPDETLGGKPTEV